MTQHECYMQRCIELAQLGAGHVSPNPMVGCVIVHGEAIKKVIGEGWHQRYGEAHAEVNAIKNVRNSSLLKESTLYVSLEPCHHFGKTPPCVDLILEHQIPKVVIGSVDPNPLVAGKSIEKLKNAGVEVIVGVLSEAAIALNKGFNSQHQHHRPYIILKWAESKDGFFAPLKGKKWLSNDFTKRLTHKWRHSVDAILVGKNTILEDNPKLNDRFWDGKPPLRVVIDPHLTIDAEHHIFTDGQPTVILNNRKNELNGAVNYVQLEHSYFTIKSIIERLNSFKINTLLVEGGAFTLNKFIDSNLWDEAYVYKTEVELSEGIPAPIISECSHKAIQPIANNQLEIYKRK
jgi:diaminohydroxyphosphoribosylaminopyrimidine deaminase/5-amino-6-(5-phosphoribosylamino)uracil reductase